MKAVCISNDPKGLADHQQSRVTAYEGLYPLTVGKIYEVVGMSIVARALYFLVRHDSGGPCFAYAGFFELFSSVIPQGWCFALEAGIRASGRDLWSEPAVATWGYPELVEDPGHVQALFELEPTALAVFESRLTEAGGA